MSAEPPFATFLFTDIEGSTRLWERQPDAMRAALAHHDALCRDCVLAHQGQIVKSTGDGIHAIFTDPLQGVLSALALQRGLAQQPTGELNLRVRAGLHCGPYEPRDGDYFGPVLNRAARIMGIAHGEQTLVSQSVAERLAGRLPAEVSLLDLGSVRLRDLSSPERVHQLQHTGLRTQFPPLRSLEATPNNLAQQLDSFVGREVELAELRQMLAGSRLLTLLGMGGLGKSRLSVQLGAELLDEYADGVWLVELAPLTDPRLVPQALASVLGVKEQPGQTVIDALLAYVPDKTLLVILDNCEHVVHACALLAKQLLQASAGVKVLASSRDVLQVAGERAYAVPTLRVPDSSQPLDLSALAQHESVRLFVDRATAAQASFRLTTDNAAAVAQICQRLDGIPLALELAAARTRALSVQSIATRLHDRFRLLVTADQTVLPRQRTLRALIDWSFDLLSEPERVLFRRLSVFAGGWTLEAAEAVCAGEGLDALEVLDLLAQLVQKSLALMEPGGARYRMLETVRIYAAERLAEGEQPEATKRRHVARFVDFAEEARGHLVDSQRAAWLQLLDQERENLLSAHAWCGADGACRQDGLRLVFFLRAYWLARGLLSLGHRVTAEALARTTDAERTVERCRALCDLGVLAYYMGRYAEAYRALDESHGIAIELGDKVRLSAALPPLGLVLAAMGERVQAMAIHEEAAKIAGELGQHRQEAVAINAGAQLHRALGDLDQARALYLRSGKQFEAMNDLDGVAITWLNLAMVEVSGGKVADAAAWLRRVSGAAASLGSKQVLNSLLEVTAGLCAAQGDAGSCAFLLGAAEQRAQLTGIRRETEDEAFLAPLIERARSLLGPKAFETHHALGRAAPDAEVSSALAAALDGEGVTPSE